MHSMALNQWGQVLSWGSDYHGQLGQNIGENIQSVPKIIRPLATYQVIQISCGQRHSIALSNSKTFFVKYLQIFNCFFQLGKYWYGVQTTLASWAWEIFLQLNPYQKLLLVWKVFRLDWLLVVQIIHLQFPNLEQYLVGVSWSLTSSIDTYLICFLDLKCRFLFLFILLNILHFNHTRVV